MAQFMPTGAPAGGAKAAWALPGFDEEQFERSESGIGVARMQAMWRAHPDGPMHPAVLANWRALGIRKELFDADSDGRYSVFTPLELDSSKRYALLYVSHGGMEPIEKTETNGFPLLAGQQDCICVCPWNGGPSNDAVETEFPRIVEQLLQRGYPVDLTRVYAVGYSAGSDATGVLVTQYPDLLAAAAPSPGGNLFAKGRWYLDPASHQRPRDHRVPFVSVGGTLDGGDRFPLTTGAAIANFNIWMQDVAQVARYTPMTLAGSERLAADSEDPVKRAFGFDFDRTFTAQLEDRDWLVGDFLDEYGVAVARFVSGVGLPHVQTAAQAPLVWDFLRHFHRDPITGGSVHDIVALSGSRSPLPAEATTDLSGRGDRRGSLRHTTR